MDPVYISHPDVEGLGGPVPRHSAEDYWVGKGWSIVEVAAAAAGSVLGSNVEDLSKLNREQLEEVAQSVGLDPSAFKSKADLLSAVESAAS